MFTIARLLNFCQPDVDKVLSDYILVYILLNANELRQLLYAKWSYIFLSCEILFFGFWEDIYNLCIDLEIIFIHFHK